MKTGVVFGIAVLCFIFSVVAKNIEDPHEVSSPSKISFDVNEFIKSYPQIIASTGTSTSAMTMGTKCECAVFDMQFPTEGKILTNAPFNVGCDCNSSGEENCRKLCSALAEAAGDHGPQLLCSALGHYSNLRASVHSRICGSKQWTYTGLTAPDQICCHEHQVINCKDQVQNPALNQI